MGIKGLFPFIHATVPSCIRKTCLADYKGKTLAIDAGGLMYKYMYGNQQGSHVLQFGRLFVECRLLGIDPIFVFDGTAPLCKAVTQQKRIEVRRNQELKNAIAESELAANISLYENESIVINKPTKEQIEKQTLELEKLRLRIIHVTNQHVVEVKQLIQLLGGKVVQAVSEAEATCCMMTRSNIAYAVVSEDSDVFPFGGTILIRGLGTSIDRSVKVQEYDITKCIELLKLQQHELIDMCILCGCDFTSESKIKGIGPAKAYDAILEFKTIDHIIASFDCKNHVPATFKFNEARDVFMNTYNNNSFDATNIMTTGYISIDEMRDFEKKFELPIRVEMEDWIHVLTSHDATLCTDHINESIQILS